MRMPEVPLSLWDVSVSCPFTAQPFFWVLEMRPLPLLLGLKFPCCSPHFERSPDIAQSRVLRRQTPAWPSIPIILIASHNDVCTSLTSKQAGNTATYLISQCPPQQGVSRRNAINVCIFGAVSVRVAFQIQPRVEVHGRHRVEEGDAPCSVHNLRRRHSGYTGLPGHLSPAWHLHNEEINVLKESDRG